MNKDNAIVNQQYRDKYVDVIVERPVFKEIIVEKPYDVIVEQPIENRIEKEVITEKYVDNPI